MANKKFGVSKEAIDKEIENLDIRGTAKNTMSWFQQYCKDVSKAPVAKQAAVGGLSGWVVGYLSMKVGKAVATVVGGSLIVIQLASHQGYIKIDWHKFNNDLESQAKKITKEMESRIKPGMKEQTIRFVRENVVLATTFAGGVLIGMASS